MARWVWGGAALVVAFALAASCSSSEEALLAALGQGCLLDSDCDGELVCAFQRCHQECATSTDCPAGLSCRLGEPPTNVCQLADEARCQLHSDCPPTQVCGPDLVCRDECLADPDCIQGQQCAKKLCAEPAELVSGELPPDGGHQGEGQPCAVNSECEVPLLCVEGRCLFECQDNSDCPSNQCVDNRCVIVPTGPPCVPGKQEACTCATGDPGVMVCQPDLEWGACSCLGGGGAGGAGGAGGSGGMGGMGAPPCTVSPSSTLVASGFVGGHQGELAFNPVSNQVMVAGRIEQQTDFGGGPITPSGPADLYLARYDTNLNYVGAVVYGGAGTDLSRALTIDSSGNAIVAGSAAGSSFSYPGGPVLSGINHHLIKVDPSGAHVWSREIGFPGGRPLGLGTDASGNIFIAGGYTYSFDLGGSCAPLTGGPTIRWFVAKLDPAGVCQWMFGTTAIGDTADLVQDLAVDANGDIVIVGTANNAVDFGGGMLNPVGTKDAIVARFSGSTGAHLGSWRYGGGTAVYGWTVSTAGTDIVVGYGAFSSASIDLGGGPDACTGNACSWLARYDATGNHLWQHRMEGGSTESQVATDTNGDVYWWGSYQGTANTVGTCTMPNATTKPPFLMRVLADGTVWWAEGYSTTQNGFINYPGLAITPAGDIFALASIDSITINVDFGMGAINVGTAFMRLTP